MSMMISKSWRALPGGFSACRPSCTIAIRIGEGAGFFRKARSRQNHVGQIAGLGQENVLHHQHLELGERLAGVIPHPDRSSPGFSPMMYMPLTVAGENALDHFDHGQTRLVVEFLDRHIPGLRKARDAFGSSTLLVVRIHHGNQPGIRGALHIVLAAQRVQPGARVCRSGRSSAPARSGSAHCRCHGCAG